MLPRNPVKTVAVLLDFFVVVEHPRDVPLRRGNRGGNRQLDCNAPLHVARPATPDDLSARTVVCDPRWQVARNRHGVQVTGNHYPLGSIEFGSSEDDVSVPEHLEVAISAQCPLHSVGDLSLVPTHRLDVDQCSQQFDDIAVQVQRRRHEPHLTASVGSGP